MLLIEGIWASCCSPEWITTSSWSGEEALRPSMTPLPLSLASWAAPTEPPRFPLMACRFEKTPVLEVSVVLMVSYMAL